MLKKNAMKRLSALVLCTGSLLTTAAEAAPSGPVEKLTQIESSKNLSQLVRSNSRNFWSLMAKKADLSQLKNYIGFEGVVSGDPHLGNFSVIPVRALDGQTQMRFVNIDFDDAGRAPFALDFIRLLIATKAANDEVKVKEMLEAYQLGLKNQTLSAPSEIKALLSMPVTHYYQLVDEYVAKRTSGDKFLMIPGEIAPYAGSISRSTIASLFPRMKVLDVAERPLTRGGNDPSENGIVRVWVLVLNERGEKRIMELKSYVATALNAYKKQPSIERWLPEVGEAFWPGLDRSSYDVKMVNGAGLMWIREKRKSMLKFEYSKANREETRLITELSVYIANHLGMVHGRQAQASEYRRRIEQDPDQFREAIKPYVKDYLKRAADALSKN